MYCASCVVEDQDWDSSVTTVNNINRIGCELRASHGRHELSPDADDPWTGVFDACYHSVRTIVGQVVDLPFQLAFFVGKREHDEVEDNMICYKMKYTAASHPVCEEFALILYQEHCSSYR
jgi:hypothetical protein